MVAGRYELQEELARGGMGAVWIATDTKLDRKVAVKILLTTDSPDAIERFEREAKTAAQLRSDHVAQVHDYGVEEGVPFIVMELLDGESLGDRLKREGSLEVGECALLLWQITRGLRAAHEAGLVHRDLKPGNIFLAKRDNGVLVKLLDFGVVKAADSKHQKENTASGVVLGTPQYMSPEQARGIRQVDHRADLWSLGVILMRALTGTNPFSSDSVGDAVIKICIDPIPRASDLVQVPEVLDHFFLKALARDPDQRYQSADDLAAAFFEAAGLDDLDGSVDVALSRLNLAAASQGTAAASLGIKLPPSAAQRDGSTGSVRTGALVRTPASATVGGTQVTSLVRPRKRPNRRMLFAAGAAALALGGLGAFFLARPSGGKPAGVQIGPAAGDSAASSLTAGPAPCAAAPAASAAPAPAARSATETQAGPAASGSSAASASDTGHPAATGTAGAGTGGPAPGVWVPSDGKQKPGKEKPKWY